MVLRPEICERARLARDPRFDGRFFVGVVTTRVYCRPVCPVRPPKPANVRFYASAAAAEAAGFRACLRCRPESAPGSPAWRGTTSTLARALRLLDEGALDDGDVARLSERLGIGDRQLRRIFVQHLGAPPVAVAQTRRLHFAKQLIDETQLDMAAVASSSGFGSVRRFNDAVRRAYGRPPTALRRRRGRADLCGASDLTLRLACRPPFDWNAMLEFLRYRAIDGLERVADGTYERSIALDGDTGVLSARRRDERSLELRVRFTNPARMLDIVSRARRMFDLSAEPNEIALRLKKDPALAPGLRAHPGLRVPGAWDGFELAVRAVLGQQVTVRAATTLAGRIVATHGAPIHGGGVSRAFPTATELARADLSRLGLPRSRARAIRDLATATRDGSLRFDGSQDAPTVLEGLRSVRGIGPWTAQVVAMRGLGEPDAFPAADAGLRSALSLGPRALIERAEAWRPWRAYAVMHLWQSLTSGTPR